MMRGTSRALSYRWRPVASHHGRDKEPTMYIRRGSTINTDRFPTLREVWRYAPLEVFWILTLQNLLSRVYESFRQDIF